MDRRLSPPEGTPVLCTFGYNTRVGDPGRPHDCVYINVERGVWTIVSADEHGFLARRAGAGGCETPWERQKTVAITTGQLGLLKVEAYTVRTSSETVRSHIEKDINNPDNPFNLALVDTLYRDIGEAVTCGAYGFVLNLQSMRAQIDVRAQMNDSYLATAIWARDCTGDETDETDETEEVSAE
jgi:hypothetical protein